MSDGWWDSFKEHYGITDGVDSKVDRILTELEEYLQGEKEINFVDRYVSISRTEENAIMRMKRVCGNLNVAMSRLIAKGFAEIYRKISSVIRIEEVRMLYEDIVGSTEEYTYVVDIPVQFDEEPSSKRRVYVHEELYYIVNWTAKAVGVDVSDFIRLCLRAGCVAENVVSKQVADRYMLSVERFVSRVRHTYAAYCGLLALSVVKSKGVVDEKLISDAERAVKVEKSKESKFVGIRGLNKAMYEEIKKIAKAKKCRVGDIMNEAMWLYIAIYNLSDKDKLLDVLRGGVKN